MFRYPDKCGPIEYINGDAYQIVARYPITKVLKAQDVKEWLGCDTVFKANRMNLYIFCNKIEDAEIVNLI